MKTKAPRKTGALLYRVRPPEERLRGFLSLDYCRAVALAVCFAIPDRDRARLFRLGDLAHQINMQETVLEARALHLDEVGELEHTLEGTGGDALIEHFTALLFLLGVFLAADGQRIFFGYD